MTDTTRKVLREVAFGFQTLAVAAFFLPPFIDTFFGGTVSVPWLLAGIINTLVFCAIWWRESGNFPRFILAIALTILTGFWSVGLLLFILVLAFLAGMYEWAGSVSGMLYLYTLFAFAAAVLAVFVPRKKID